MSLLAPPLPLGRAKARAAALAFVALGLSLPACSSSEPVSAPVASPDAGATADADAATVTAPPTPCATSRAAGTQSLKCEGLALKLAVPATCPPEGCGLILDLHGALMSADLIDAQDELRARGNAKGYVVAQPTAPVHTYKGGVTGAQWFNDDDAALIRIVEALVVDLAVDKRRVHVAGFSQGGFATLRLFCKRADLFASVAPGAAGIDGCPLEKTQVAGCPFTADAKPSRNLDVLFLYGTKDLIVPEACAAKAVDAIVQGQGLGAPTTVESKTGYQRKKYTGGGVTLETLVHDYEAGASLKAINGGHCVPGSKAKTGTLWDELACVGAEFVWGEEVIKFFEAHPRGS